MLLLCSTLRLATVEIQNSCYCIGHRYARTLLILTALRAAVWGLECRKFSQLLLDESLLLHFLQCAKKKYYEFTLGVVMCKWLESFTLDKPHIY